MRIFRYFTRGISNLSVTYKMYLLVTVVLLGIVFMTGLYIFGINTLSVVQFYIRAEGLWAKGQKNATYSLERYIYTHDEEDYLDFLEFLRVPEGDKKARIELEKPNPDWNVAYQGFIEGGNAPEDVQQASKAFKQFREFGPADRAIRMWAEGDRLIAELKEVGAQLHELFSNRRAATEEAYQARLDELLGQIVILNHQLTHAENEFSTALYEGSRQVKRFLLTMMFLGVAITVTISLFIAVIIGRDFIMRINSLLQVTQEAGKGNLEERVEITSNDEIGHLAVSFNRMSESLQKSLDARRRLEEALQQRQEELEAIYEGMTDGLLIVDAENGRFLATNPSFRRMLGYSEKELLSLSLPDIHPPEDLSDVYEQFTRMTQGKQNIALDIRVMRKDKSVFYADIAAHTVSYNKRSCVVGFFRDITQRKETEEELKRHAEALESANKALEVANATAEAATRAKSEFLANMSHEIRTPMTAILGFVDILMESLKDREQRDAAMTIKQNGEYLIKIINNILDLSKIESGKLEVELIQCSPCQILSEIFSLMQVRTHAKNLDMEVEYDGPVPQYIQSDPTRLRQILFNLTGNAIKFTEAGKVRLMVRLLDAECDKPKMQFEVVDSGIGMTEEQIANIFRPFYQADASTTRRFGGTGLGLVISKRLAKMLGGDIAISSSPGKGSTFSLTVETGPLDEVQMLHNPSITVAETDQEAESALPQVRLDCRILLVEDGPDNQRLISLLLEKAGAEVELAENGRIACEKALAAHANGEPYCVILMDMQMPVMDGYNATVKLRKAGYAAPIIALTAHAMSTDRKKCLTVGCNDYITKPINRKKLITVVAEYALSGTPQHQ